MKPWKRIEPTTIQKVGWRTIVTKTFELPNGQTEEFQLYDIEGRQFVAVVALTPDRKVIVVRQFRPGPERFMDELPGGFADSKDEGNILAAAKRELEEETGYRPGKLTYLGPVYKDCYSNAVWNYCLAEDCVPTGRGQQLEHVELGGCEALLITIDRLIQNSRTGKMTDVEGVLLAYDHLIQARA